MRPRDKLTASKAEAEAADQANNAAVEALIAEPPAAPDPRPPQQQNFDKINNEAAMKIANAHLWAL